MSYIEQARKLRPIIEKAMAETDDLTASAAVELSPVMKYNGGLIKAGTRINHGGMLKRAAADLWDTEANNPDNAPALWEDVAYRDGIRIIPETISASAAFALEERGWWQGKLYESKINANVYTPEQYPAGWEEVTQ